MAELTLGQMLDSAIGTPKTEPINFEQLRNLLNGMLVNLGLRDLPVQESGEPLEGAPKIPPAASMAADLEELKQKTETHEREITELRALCEELRVEVNEVKEQQSHMEENMQKMQETLDTANFGDGLRNQVLDTDMDMTGQEGQDMTDQDGLDMTGQDGQDSPDWPQGPAMLSDPWEDQVDAEPRRSNPWEDRGLIVIGNEIVLVDRFGTSSPRQRDTRASSPVPSKSRAEAQSRGKDLPPGVTSSPRVSFTASDVGRNSIELIKDEEIQMGISKGAALPSPKAWSRGKNLPRGAVSSPRVSFVESDMGWNDMGQIQDEEIKMGISKGAAFQSPKAWSRGKNVPHGVRSSPRVSFVESDVGWDDVEQSGDDEEIKTSISKAKALPSPLGTPPEMNDMEQIKDKETEMSFSKRKSLDDGVAALRVHPGSPGIHGPIQPVKSGRGHPASQTLWIPAESVPGTDSGSRSRTAKEAQARGSFRMDPSQIEPGMKLLKVPSPEYVPRGQSFAMPVLPGPPSPPGSPALPVLSPPGSPARSRRSDTVSYTPPPSPGLTGRLPPIVKQHHERGQREQAEGYSRRSPMYSGGRHTSICPVQPMEPLLPDPSKPGVFDLVGRDGIVYRGRQSRTPLGSWMEGARYSNLQ